jgi:hypothetical protein
MATKKEFTAQDMKKAFLAGERIGSGAICFDRWIRSQYPPRYARKKKKS